MGTQHILVWYKENKVYADLSTTNTRIQDSYRISSKSDMKAILEELRERSCSTDMAINLLSINEMVREWRAHNLLYDLHLFRSHTKDVDLNIGNPWCLKVLYAVVSLLYCLVLS